jgi:hypothetical protein
MKKLIYSVLLVISISSCDRVACINPRIYIKYEGFKSAEIDTVIANQYAKDSDFSVLLKTDSSFTSEISGSTDWEIIIPSAQRSIRIKNINFHNDHQKLGWGGVKDECGNGADYNVDGVVYSKNMQMGTDRSVYPIEIEFKK